MGRNWPGRKEAHEDNREAKENKKKVRASVSYTSIPPILFLFGVVRCATKLHLAMEDALDAVGIRVIVLQVKYSHVRHTAAT